VKTRTATEAMTILKPFMNRRQHRAVLDLMKGEEGQFFVDKMIELADRVEAMPATYETEGQDDPIVYLHYFGPGDWFIYEKDKGSEDDAPEDAQSQTMGLADLYGDGGELGYISLPELFSVTGLNEVQLDFHWEPRPLSEARKYREHA
jgi:hypothetical protein